MNSSDLFSVFEGLAKMFLSLTALVFGLVQFIKVQTGAEGKTVTVISFVVGVVVAGVVSAAYLYPEWGTYLGIALFMVAGGLVASGFYKFGQSQKQ